jgi:hypothetical protein
MRATCRIAIEAAVVVALVAACGRTDARAVKLAELAKELAALPADGDPTTLALPKDVQVTVDGAGFSLAFAGGVDAAELARACGWKRPYAISGDVHQQEWTVALFAGELKDPYRRRIATTQPRLGAWTVRAELDGRPAGELPDVVAGASPAYDLGERHARVMRLRLVKAP